MKNTLIFATHNRKKTEEIRSILKTHDILSLSDLNFTEEIEETGSSLEENAEIKARTIYEKFKLNCFADDSGLMVDCLKGEPGVFSGRYAGEPRSDEKNIRLLLKNMEYSEHRAAAFVTCICLIHEGQKYFFEGKIMGEILKHPHGNNGFGYDPVFKPRGQDKSFAAMSADEKNNMSHRGIAVNKLVDFLNKIG